MTTQTLQERLQNIARKYEDMMGLTRDGAIRRIHAMHDAILDIAYEPDARDARIAQLGAELAKAREGLNVSERAIAEYYRYWTGGEMRGSYDGKPERNGLWHAMYNARTTLASMQENNDD